MDLGDTIDRNDVPTLKWSRSYLAQHFGNEDAIPMSVADMDLRSPPAVVERLTHRVAHGIYGYGTKPESYFGAIEDWYRTRHDWSLDRRDLLACPSIVSAISILIEQHSREGDGVLVQPPVFFEFKSAIRGSKRTLVKNPLRLVDGRYEMDFADLEAKASEPTTKVFILCNPHNPVGRAWDDAELAELVEFCKSRDLILVSDEIHCDLIWKEGVKHRTALNLGDWARENSLTLMAPSKTFNVPGLSCSFIIIPNLRLRAKFQHAARGMITEVNCMGYTGCDAAYRHGEPWRLELMRVLRGNYERVFQFVNERMPRIKMRPMEATYLAWLDVRDLGLEHPDRYFEDHGVGLSNGAMFSYPGYLRLNFGCPRAMLEQALERMAAAYDKLGA